MRTLPTYRGPMIQVEAAKSSVDEVLKEVTNDFGIRDVIAPELEEQKLNRSVYRSFLARRNA